jgi:predicted phage-related endonuclease
MAKNQPDSDFVEVKGSGYPDLKEIKNAICLIIYFKKLIKNPKDTKKWFRRDQYDGIYGEMHKIHIKSTYALIWTDIHHETYAYEKLNEAVYDHLLDLQNDIIKAKVPLNTLKYKEVKGE